MLSGKRFRLKRDTISLHSVDGDRKVVMIPKDAILEVLSGPKPDDKRMVDVQWGGKALVMFAEDLQARGEEVSRAGA